MCDPSCGEGNATRLIAPRRILGPGSLPRIPGSAQGSSTQTVRSGLRGDLNTIFYIIKKPIIED